MALDDWTEVVRKAAKLPPGTTFHPFTTLPTELRLKVWEKADADDACMLKLNPFCWIQRPNDARYELCCNTHNEALADAPRCYSQLLIHTQTYRNPTTGSQTTFSSIRKKRLCSIRLIPLDISTHCATRVQYWLQSRAMFHKGV